MRDLILPAADVEYNKAVEPRERCLAAGADGQRRLQQLEFVVQRTRFAFGDGVYGSETAMAPRVGSVSEDDGYLVTITTDMNADASYCLVFDAARVGDGPVCKLALPERVSSGTHSTWASGSELRRWQQTYTGAEAISRLAVPAGTECSPTLSSS